MAGSGEERRVHKRSFKSFKGIQHASDPGVTNHVDNISASGVLCHTERPIPVMTKIGVTLDLPEPSDASINCEGVIVRCDPDQKGEDHFKVAIVFTKLDNADMAAIKKHVELTAGDHEGD